MSKYHPYHFIPLYPATHPAVVDVAAFEKGQVPHLTHDSYVRESRGQRCFSGRLVCALESVSPLVIGAEHDDRQQPVTVKPFLLPDGQPAIPASSLRGLISSVAEAASNSALRVLSLRKGDSKSAGWPCFQGAPGFPANFFADVSLDLLPLGQRAAQPGVRAKKRLTLAEQLFGFVEQGKSTDSNTGRSFAGRVRFSTARLLGNAHDWFASEFVTLAILSTPNPLSASIYFKRKDGRPGRIKGPDLNLDMHTPQGRKAYLDQEITSPADWQDPDQRRPKMQVRARPLRDGLCFQFHLDFDNLTETELGLLAYALRPTPDFRHKLGLGKPIGLGCVCLTPLGLFLIDRRQRYASDPLDSPQRYHSRWIEASPPQAAAPPSWLADRYPHELAALSQSQLPTFEFPVLRQQFRQAMLKLAPDIIDSLELLGEDYKQPSQVGYFIPCSSGQYLPPLPNRDRDDGIAQIPLPVLDPNHQPPRHRY
jgi:hypothetical protein